MPTRVPTSPSDRSGFESTAQSPRLGAPARPSLAMRLREEDAGPAGVKRKRADTHPQGNSGSRQKTNDLTNGSDDGLEDDRDDVYDPDQPLEERRKLQHSIREIQRDIEENSEQYLEGSNGLHQAILRANELAKQVRQTTEAAIDSRLLVSTSDLSYRKALRLTQGSLSQGIDVDEFVSKCIAYMRTGPGIEDMEPQSASAQGSRALEGDEEEEGDAGDMMNWSHLGRFACLPSIRRPALPGFLLGPLSVEKKARRATRRSAALRPNNLTETRPEVIKVEDLVTTQNELFAICGQILDQLKASQEHLQNTVANLLKARDDLNDEEQTRIMHQHGLRSTGGIDLMRFVVNPNSFGQTVENLFYVSFLIRDGHVGIDYDEYEIPALAPVKHDEEQTETRQKSGSKHQAILSMDMATWRDIIDTFELVEPMIAHREEDSHSGPGARGWYS